MVLWRGEGEYRMYSTKIIPAIAIAAALIFFIPMSALAVSASQVTLNFMCPCGTCDEALSTCECPQSDGFRSQIAGMVGDGYTEEQIIQNFKGQFGSSVLITNAAMAPNSGGLLSQAPSKKTIGMILLVASFSLVAFSLGKYMNAAPASAPARRRSKQRPQASPKSSKRSEKRENKPGKGFRDGVDDELLDDYDY
jgi:hypothetical protein